MTHRTRLIIASSISALTVPGVVFAQTFMQKIQGGAKAAATPAGYGSGPPLETMIGNAIGALLTFVGVILLVIMIYAGFLYMTAGGNPEQVKKAREWIINSIIGLVIITASYAIVNFVLNSFTGATTGGGAVSGGPLPP
jgi:hypothetical protein